MTEAEIREVNLALEILGKHPLADKHVDFSKFIEWGKSYNAVRERILNEEETV